MSSFVKNGLTLVGLIIIGGFGYYLFFLDSNSNVSLSSQENMGTARLASEQFIRELNEAKTFDLSDDLFKDQRFRSLVDFAKPVPTFKVGRVNPFAPVE